MESYAFWAVMSYVLAIGDRHLKNILMNINNGTINFVDFELVFKLGLKQPVPEIVSIRMTNILELLHGSFGFEGVFIRWFSHITKVFFGDLSFQEEEKVI